MKKIDAIVEVLSKKGKVIAVSKRWNNTVEHVACDYMLTDKFEIQEVKK